MSSSSNDISNYHGFTLVREWAAGGVANAITSALLNPLDVAKTRMQSAAIATTDKSKRRLTSIMAVMYEQGGVIGLWRPGLAASMIREIMSSGPRAGFYVPVRTAVSKIVDPDSSGTDASVATKLLAAMTTGTMGSIIANPIDVVKIRLMANPQAYSGVMSGITSIYSIEGFAGLYKGVVPSTLRGAFIACGELATYDITKTAIKTHLGVQDSIPLHVLCSLITGLVATSVAAPFDMIKTRSMNAVDNTGPWKILTTVVKEGGVLALFRGWLPAYLRLGPHALICFPIFEQFRWTLGLDYL